MSFLTEKSRVVCLTVLLTAMLFTAALLHAADPPSGSIAPNNPPLSWTGTASGGFYVSHDPLGGDSNCTEGNDCDTFTLTVSGLASDWSGKTITVDLNWTLPSNDYDLYIHKGSNAGQTVDSSGNPNGLPEEAFINPGITGTGVYTVHVVYFDVAPGVDQYRATATISTQPIPPPNPPPGAGIPPRYQTYAAPGGLGTDSGEPSIGSDWKTGKTMFEASTQTLRVSFDDCSSPAKTNWEDVSALSSLTTLDPILFTNSKDTRNVCRSWVSQLTGINSLSSFSDDDGDNWMPNEGGPGDSGPDHQTIGAGPFAPGIVGAQFPYAVYYCSQASVTAFCALSVDGGQTYRPAVPIFSSGDCDGIHGHVKVAPDGTVYVPNRSCGANQAVIVSKDNGINWQVVKNPTSLATSPLVDPSVGIGQNGTVYFGYQNSGGAARVAVLKKNTNGTFSWSNDQDVGAQLGIQNATFPTVVAGDDNRAAYAFLGTTTPGDYTDPTTFPSTAVWHLYVSHTFDGGVHWQTVDATPNDPVQRGTICNLGTIDCDHVPDDRNLLDFIDITADAEGRAVVGFADGCIGGCIQSPPNSYTSLATIARQSGGRRLFAQFDPLEPSVPAAPGNLSAIADGTGFIRLSWTEPDDGGSPITKYRIYRKPDNGSYSLLAESGKASYTDISAQPGTQYFYKVSAINAIGEGATCGEVTPVSVTPPDPCSVPGVKVSEDTSDVPPNIPPDPSVDIKKLFVAEPYLGAGINKLVFTLQVAPSTASAPANSQWYIIWNKLQPDVDFDRNYVAMTSDAAGNLSFEYGKLGVPLDPINPNPNANMPVKLGDADSGGYDPKTGMIMISVSNSKVENIHAGQDLIALNARTFFNRPQAGQPIPQASSSDFGPDGNYTLAGNASCKPNNPPVAVLTVTPQTGNPPLNVTLDGSQSSDPDGDQIVAYIFNFGDGSSPVTQSSPSISHTYQNAGDYRATLTVKDIKGAASNVDSKVIEVQQAADLSITNTDSPDPAKVGQNLTYTIKVKNNGPSNATGVKVSDILPKSETYKSATATQGSCSINKTTVTCNLGNISNGASATVTLLVKPNSKGTVTNTATVAAIFPQDPNSSNNSATASTVVK